MSYGISQSYLPPFWLGDYVFPFGPKKITRGGGGANVATHNILNQQDANEIVGWAAPSWNIEGFIASTSVQAIKDMHIFTTNSQSTAISQTTYATRPFGWGTFTQDGTNLYIWDGGVAYLNTNQSWIISGGYGLYKFPYRLSLIGAGTAVAYLIPLTDSGDHTNFTAYLTGDGTSTGPTIPSGYIVGLQILPLSGTQFGNITYNSEYSIYVSNVRDVTTSTNIGSGPNIILPNASSGVVNVPGTDQTGMIYPFIDTSFNPSIYVTTPAANGDQVRVTFAGSGFNNSGGFGASMNLLYLPA